MSQKRGTTTTVQADATQTGAGLQLVLANLPETAATSDKKALRAQNLYQRTVGVEQLLLVVAAAGGLASLLLALLNISGTTAIVQDIVIVALAGTVVTRLLRTVTHSDVDWYDSRALAEEIQSQSWRYVMRASPYEDPSAGDGAQPAADSPEMRFVEECRRLRDSSKAHLPAESTRGSAQISETMKRVRDASLPERIEVYKRDRLQDQHDYYLRRSKLYQNRARVWNILILLVEAVALAASGAKFVGLPFGLVSTDIFGLAGTIVAGAAAWVQMKQFSALSRRYSAMARNLEGYMDALKYSDSSTITQEYWSQLVNRVEQLLEHEHENWLNLYRILHYQMQQGQMGQVLQGGQQLPPLR